MPLSNDKEKDWTGWLIDGRGGREAIIGEALLSKLRGKELPKTMVNPGRINMWWRPDSLYIDVTSTMDGKITCTIHIQEYGTSLWIGRAVESYRQSNYYKRMASAAFMSAVDGCIADTISDFAEAEAAVQVTDIKPLSVSLEK